MPELPEVQALVTDLGTRLGGRTVDNRQAVEARRQRNRGELRLVAHLGEEEGDQRGDERTGAVDLRIAVERIRMQRPQAEADE